MSASLIDVINAASRVPLTEDDERDLIFAAQDGDHDAQLLLLRNYLPLIKAELHKSSVHQSSGGTSARNGIDHDDLEMAAVEAFYDALAAFDPDRGQRLAGTLPSYIRSALYNERGALDLIHVPARTRARQREILRAAGGDFTAARELAPSLGMDAATFSAVGVADDIAVSHPAVAFRLDASPRGGIADGAIDEGAAAAWTSTGLMTEVDSESVVRYEPNVEAMVDARKALAGLDDTERRVVRLAYGFDGEPLSTREIEAETGISKSSVHRILNRAISKMQHVLGA